MQKYYFRVFAVIIQFLEVLYPSFTYTNLPMDIPNFAISSCHTDIGGTPLRD